MGISNERYAHARLEAALGLVVGLTVSNMWGVIVNVTFAVDGNFDAGRIHQGPASGSSYLHPASSVLARCCGEPMPQLLPLNLYDGVSPH